MFLVIIDTRTTAKTSLCVSSMLPQATSNDLGDVLKMILNAQFTCRKIAPQVFGGFASHDGNQERF